LGARARDVMIGAVRQAATVACAGSAVGLIASFVLASGLESLLFGVSPHDPLTLMSGVSGLFLVAIAAAAIPARRASSIDPAATLRAD